VKDWLESEESGDWILVLDNADNKLDFFPNTSGNSNAGLAKYIPQATKGAVITTRDYEVALQLAGTKAVLTKKAMQSSDAEALFRHHYPGWVPHDKSDCVQLLRELQHLPLAVVQVASYLEMNRHILTAAQYLKRYRGTKEDERILLSKSVYSSWRSRSASTGSETVLTTFAITFRQIQEHSPLADAIPTVIACIDPQGIPHQLLADVEGENDDILLGEALAKLHNLSLLQVTSTYNINKSDTVHSLVHLAIQHFLAPQDRDTALRKTAHHLMEVLPPNGEFKHWPAWRQYLPHTTVFLHNSQLLRTPEVASICYGTADYLITTGRYRDAQVLAERAVSIRTMVLGEGHSETIDAIICLANIFRCQGKLKDAERLEAGLLKKRALRFGETDQDTLTSMNNLAITFSFRGRLKEAEELQSEVLEIDRKLRGEKHRDTLTSMNNLATIFFKQGRLREAELLLVKVLETRTKVLGTNHPDTLSTMSNLALTFNLQGRFKKAEKLDIQVLEISTDRLGKEHPDTLASMNNLAITLRKQGRGKEAEELQVKGPEVEKRVLGEEHPDTLTSMNNLTTTLSQQDRWSEAEEL
jgi:tetratricopeptide (TPR) repeat protein